MLGRATLAAADWLGVDQTILAAILGVSPSTVSRMRGEASVLKNDKSVELAVLFVRVSQTLEKLTNGDREAAARWLRSPNLALRSPPLKKMQTVRGLLDVLQYLDTRPLP